MKGKALVIVESPTKAKTLRKFLPKNYIIEASMGHVRDLPQSATAIPKKYKEQEWSKLGVNVEGDFEPIYVIPKGKSKIVTELRKKLKEADVLYLATDDDREGESISWHLHHLLKPKVPVKRMVFGEITKTAILKSLENCRDVDLQVVRSQETRRILDRLYGYTLSPLLWKKICYGLSAGRVQSPGLKMLVDREHERIDFRKAEYWDLEAQLTSSHNEGLSFTSRSVEYKGKKIAQGKDFSEKTGKLIKGKSCVIIDEKEAKKIAADLKKEQFVVEDITDRSSTSRPLPPFITSTLQQDANRKLGLSAKMAMRVAQKLYEVGMITYMRTDSPTLSKEAIAKARDSVVDLYGKDYLETSPRQFKSKSKGAQEAHEAIRPAGDFVSPDKSGLTGDELRLYTLIWRRTIASQMKDAKKSSQTIKLIAGDMVFSATGTKIVFPGFLKAYQIDQTAGPENILPDLKKGEKVTAKHIKPLHHETKPPARFNEASLVQRLEKEGIGRPSTYASIIGTILDRGYVRKEGNNLIPTFMGIAVIQLLDDHFKTLIDYSFTSEMENALDQIELGELENIKYLKKFYLGKKGLRSQIEENEKDIKATVSRTIRLASLDKAIDLRIGKYGPYVVSKPDDGGEAIHASIPEEIAPADLSQELIDSIVEQQAKGPIPIGHHPDTNEPVFCLMGRYGAYLQLGEVTEENPKPKRSSLPKPYTPQNIPFEEALKLLSLPRELGENPKNGKMVMANLGRFGPYVGCDGDFRSLKKEDDLYAIDLERALELLAQEKKTRRGSKLIKDLGNHPKKKKKINLYEGKYGLYLKMGTKNFTLADEYKKAEMADKIDLKLATETIDNLLKK